MKKDNTKYIQIWIKAASAFFEFHGCGCSDGGECDADCDGGDGGDEDHGDHGELTIPGLRPLPLPLDLGCFQRFAGPPGCPS